MPQSTWKPKVPLVKFDPPAFTVLVICRLPQLTVMDTGPTLGLPSSIFQTITAGVPDSTIALRFNEYNFFINDNWRLRPRPSAPTNQ